MPACVPISAIAESHNPRWPIASLSVSAAKAGLAMSTSARHAPNFNARIAASPSGRPPYLLRQFYHQPQLCFLHVRADRVAQLGAGEAALRADGETVERDEAAGLIDALPERGF